MRAQAVRAQARTLTRMAFWPVVLLATVLTLGGCALFYQRPSVEIVDVRVVGLGFTSGTAEVILEVENPNHYKLEVRELRYLLEIEERSDLWRRLAQGISSEHVELPRRSSRTVSLRVPFEYDAVGAAVRSWWNTGEVTYRIQGDLKARGPGGERDLPFRARGKMAP